MKKQIKNRIIALKVLWTEKYIFWLLLVVRGDDVWSSFTCSQLLCFPLFWSSMQMMWCLSSIQKAAGFWEPVTTGPINRTCKRLGHQALKDGSSCGGNMTLLRKECALTSLWDTDSLGWISLMPFWSLIGLFCPCVIVCHPQTYLVSFTALTV